ncbi:CRE-PBS-2 protein [Aphelenchoides avenae]|nr:CRE-PBS-2 protein [Aphelenchus avenae]
MSGGKQVTMGYEPAPAFDFSNCTRNVAMVKCGAPAPRLTSTGTTIVAATFKDGIVMGADSRATAGNIIADKDCEKVKELTESIFACGAGTAADLHQVGHMLAANLRLQELNTGKKARVVTALKIAKQHLFQYQGYIGAYLLIGGVDETGPHLFEISANGYTQRKPFSSEGSGSYNATTILERDYKFDMDEKEAKALVQRALEAGMHGDNASGNSLYLVVINKDSTVREGPIIPDFCKLTGPIELQYRFPTGSTTVLKQRTFKYEVVESMDVSH